MKKIFLSFLFLVSVFWAVTVDADFVSSTNPDYYYSTDIMVNSDFELSLVSGEVVSGDPSDLQSGAQVCEGSVIRVTPEMDSKWAVGEFSARSIFPGCGELVDCNGNTIEIDYCSFLMDYDHSSFSHNREIGWLDETLFDDYLSVAQSFNHISGCPGEDMYNQLGSGAYTTQPITYANEPIIPDTPNKKGLAAVFCKGKLSVERNGVSISSGLDIATQETTDIALSSTGTNTISVALEDANCFGSVVKRALDSGTNFFRISFYSDDQFSISSSAATESKTIQVVEGGEPCDFEVVSSTYTGAKSAGDVYLVSATVRNNGNDPMIIDGVSASFGYDAAPFDPGTCTTLGFPSSVCPINSGFNIAINPGSEHTVYMFVNTHGNDIESAAVMLSGESTVSVCGSFGGCSERFNPQETSEAVSCEIVPDSINAGRLMAYEWTVTCYDINNNPVSCVGNNWYFGGLSGIFVERTNTHTIAGVDSPVGSTGTLNYESGLAVCHSDITVVDPDFVCEFTPSSAGMEVSDEQYFDLTCYWEGQEVTIDDATYGTDNGLTGTLSNESTDGVTFGATQESSGILWGLGWYQHPSEPHMVGGIAVATITVGSEGNETENGGEDEEEDCQIGDTPGPLTAWPGYHTWLPLWCGETFDEHCGGVVTWTYTPPDEGTAQGDNLGADATVTGPFGSSAVITAHLEDGGFCTKDVNVIAPNCWEFS